MSSSISVRRDGHVAEIVLDRAEAHNALSTAMASDLDGDPVFLAPSAFMLQWTAERTPELRFTDVKSTVRA